MNEQDIGDPTVLNTLEKIAELARRSWTRPGVHAALLGRWLRAQPASGLSRLRRLLRTHHLLQRQRAYRNAGGSQSGVMRHMLARVAGVGDSGKDTNK